MTMTKKVLIITTNIDSFETIGFKTGLWLSELVTFYNTLEKAGYEMDIASPQGGKTPLDPQSLILPHLISATGLNGGVTNKYQDQAFAQKLEHALPLNFVKADKYEDIYLTGGHGVMYAYPHSKALQNLLTDFDQKWIVWSAGGHGSPGGRNAKLAYDTPLLYGNRETGYSWLEEKLARIDHAVPFDLEADLRVQRRTFRVLILPFNTRVVHGGTRTL